MICVMDKFIEEEEVDNIGLEGAKAFLDNQKVQMEVAKRAVIRPTCCR